MLEMYVMNKIRYIFLSQTRSRIKIYVGMTKIDVALFCICSKVSFSSVQRP